MELKENELIKRLKRFGKRPQNVLRGIGDDGAVVELGKGLYVFVQDGMAEHIHFEFDFMDAYHVGKKSVYANVSDILSMGALPLYFLVTIGIPEHVTYKQIQSLYKGMGRAATEFNITLIGGDTVASKNDFFIDVSMVGRLVTERYLGRDKSREGDLIAVTGWLGESAYGLNLLRKHKTIKGYGRFTGRYINPKPPFSLWKELIKSGITNSMMDISDGLVIDLERMMAESKKCAKISFESLPIPTILKKEGMEHLALAGGEDYQFLFTFPQHRLQVIGSLRKNGFPISIIGEVARGRGVKIIKDGKVMIPDKKGYEHFGDQL